MAEYLAVDYNGLFNSYKQNTEYLEAPVKKYQVDMTMYLNTIERKMWDELRKTAAADNLKDMVFTWTRSATDKIEVTCSDCKVIRVTKRTNPQQLVPEQVTIEPRAISIVVTDSIDGAVYYA